ncbi:tumor necrosis factor ligand superfamily member 15-like [Trachinotus anak]|uniref:tumor necrosis factor ligand superfamily member 15-like n=1 Tax=Trachinotus anak TaxID=443729 RepID=UPI0039F21B5C
MGQKLMGPTLPAEAASGDAVADMGQDESVLILIKHCRDMKQQESCLRLVTLLLLLSCTTLFVFIISADLRQRGDSGSSGQRSAAEQHPAYSKQKQLCPADHPQNTSHRPHIHLRSVDAENRSNAQYIKWNVEFGERYDEERRAIVIPKTGVYFIYVTVTLTCQEEDPAADFNRFYVELRSWNKGYDMPRLLTKAWNGITCINSEGPRSVFVGQLFDLLAGDHVSVWIGAGYNLIMKSSFGAYLA